jgi:RNA polymerase sigma factor (sigma-70 family)
MVDRTDGRAKWDAEVSAYFRTHSSQLHRTLLSRLGNEQEARDAAQEVFLRFSDVGNVDLVKDPIKYLYGIARNVVGDILKKRRREPVEFNSDLIAHHSEHPPDQPTDKVGDSVETQQALMRALGRLRPIERKIIILLRCEGMSHAEVAEALKLSKHTVKKYAAHAMAQLKIDLVSSQFGGKAK